ncbi:hypothetical protein ES332_A12G269300v1 [Gossypium tomentosum]|uniref:RING-type E3 ubiquitin transferase n=1 Tax=Gossypium tomentosum TaxID=34277 RepID=A0A5D2N2I5_GOSTO|nr:hypothetical protein ES332_A12G269300v1 [Gossypium tomentosum]
MALTEIVFFSIFLMFTLQPSTSVEICPVLCGTQLISFPFRLNTQPGRCGYPRFDLSCKNEAHAILTIPFSGGFTVVNIDYIFQNIWIEDPDSCAPRRILQGLNLSGTPFDLLEPRSYTFFNCSSASSTVPELAEAKLISCLSGKDFSVVAIPTERLDLPASLSTSCSEMAKVLLPLSLSDWSDPGDGFILTWNEPDCKLCQSRAGTCMFKNDTGTDVGCSGGFNDGLTRSTKLAIVFGVGIPFSFILGLVIYLRGKVQDHQNLNPTASSAMVVKGLDGQILESYPITLLGESRRLTRPSDNICSICLNEYHAKEILRTTPDCNHYFHAVCIDEWLKLNVVCPLCRSFPMKLISNVTSSRSLISS